VHANGKTLHQGLMIAKTENEIAIFEKNQSLILKLSQDILIIRDRSQSDASK
jgi:hypothetical protein